MLLNGKPVGEIDVIAAMAGHFGTPVIMPSGDQAAANEIREIVPDVEVAVLKEGIGRYTCIGLSAPGSPAPKYLRTSRRPSDYTAMKHLSDHDLERYHLGMIREEAELATLEEHIIGCGACADRAAEVAAYVDAIRAGVIAGNYDLNSYFKAKSINR